MKKHFKLSLCIFFLFGIFLLLSLAVGVGAFAKVDLWVTIFLQRYIGREFDTFFSVFSILGSFEVSCFFLLLSLVYFYFSRKGIFSSGLIVLCFGLVFVFELFGKLFIHHSGPSLFFVRYKHFVTFPSDILPHPIYSFPSGHSSRTLFLSTVLLLLVFGAKRVSKIKKMLLFVTLFIYDLIMVVSRIDLGEHWLSDVLGGIFLGAALGSIAIWFIRSEKFR